MKHFSARLDWPVTPNSFSELVSGIRTAGEPLLDLSVSNPTEVISHYPHREIAQIFGQMDDLTYRPEPLGLRSAREEIAHWYRQQEIAAKPENIALTASSSEAYAILFKLLCDAGDEVLVPRPSYPLFDYLARAESIQIKTYHLHYDGSWFIDWQSVKAAASGRTRLIVTVNPNNPTGSYLKTEEALKLQDFADEREIAILSDEVFMTYPSGQSAGAGRFRTFVGHNRVLSFSLNGLSKAACMPQMKLGWIVVNGPTDERANALGRLELLLDNYLSVGTPVQKALPDLMRIGGSLHYLLAARIEENRRLLKTLTGSAVQPLESEGGWSVLLQVPNVISEDDWIRRLLTRERVLIQPGYFYDISKEAFLVASLIAEPAAFAAALEKIKRLAGEL